MNDVTAVSDRRYRRRILASGAAAFVVIFAIGATFALSNVQNDLGVRVGEALADAAVVGVDPTFSGQDGTLSCEVPLVDPDAVRRLAARVDGVRSIELDEACSAQTSDAVEAPDADLVVETTPEPPPVTSTLVPVIEPEVEPELEPEPEAVPAAVAETVLDVLDRDPLFTTLSALTDMADLRGRNGLAGPGAFTVFAPTDAAFDAAFVELGADDYQALVDDPERLRTLLLHHVSAGGFTSSDLSTGTLEMLDGTEIEVRVDRTAEPVVLEFVSDDVVAGVDDPGTQLDIVVSNGVVHAIDRLLVPTGLVVEPEPVVVAAVLTGENLLLSGSVARDIQRNAVLAAATTLDLTGIDDEIVVDPSVDVPDVDVARLGDAIRALDALITGEARLDGVDVSVSGVAVDALAVTTLEEFGTDNGVGVDVSVRATADESSAAQLEADLNALVAANPVRFDTGTADTTPASNVVLVDVARRVLGVDGISLGVVGHTDSSADPVADQQLSEDRADAVRFTLLVLGLDPGDVTARGVGSSEPILVDGVEDGDASRRVRFEVVVAP